MATMLMVSALHTAVLHTLNTYGLLQSQMMRWCHTVQGHASASANHNKPNLPTPIRNDYFCATGSHQEVQRNAFYVNQKLWYGKGCGQVNTCCAMNHPPWFYQPTTDEIEMRVCRDEDQDDEDIAIENYEIYIH